MIIDKLGILSTFQDYGFELKAEGVNTCGVMDKYSFDILNILLQNPENTTALEFHFPAPIITFEENTFIAITGADFEPKINNKQILNNKVYEIKIGDTLRFSKRIKGQRAYLGVKNGFILEKLGNSYGTHLILGVNVPKLADSIKINLASDFELSKVGISARTQMLDWKNNEMKIVLVTENKTIANYILNTKFTININSDRIGYKLNAEDRRSFKINVPLSSFVSKGTVQLLPDGDIVILMADAQLTGGYSNIGYICEADLNILAQKGPNETVSFNLISHSEAVKKIVQDQVEITNLAKNYKLSFDRY